MLFRKGVVAEIVARAAGSTDEVCGLLISHVGGDAPERSVPFERVDAALHCSNVAANPATAFEIDPAQLIAAHRAARAGGPAIVGCYHSHPRGAPEPSLRDAAEAVPNGWLWLIVAGGDLRLWRAVPDGERGGRFDPLSVRFT